MEPLVEPGPGPPGPRKKKQKAATPGGPGVLSRFTRRVSFDFLVFSWVNATKYVLPSVTVQDAIKSALKFYGLQEIYKFDAAERSYYRLYDEWVQEQRAGYNNTTK